jgi:Sporulation and spore germination
MRRRRAVVPALVAACLVAVLAGCGIGAQQHASVIDSHDVPSILLQTTDSASPTQSPSQAPTSIIYLLQSQTNRLVPVRRPKKETASLLGLLHTLLAGPSDNEVNEGLSTALSAAPNLHSVAAPGQTATINLGATFTDIRGQSQVLATAQLVLTAVSYPDVSSVLIEIDGTPAAVPLADGTLTTRPVRFADYSCLIVGVTSGCTAGVASHSASASSSSAQATVPPSSPGSPGVVAPAIGTAGALAGSTGG